MFSKNSIIRIALIASFFAIGLFLVIFGWTFTGKASGLWLMILGVVFLLTSLFVYNKPYSDKNKTKNRRK